MLRTETANNIVYANKTTSTVGTGFLDTTVKQDAYSNILKNATVVYSKEYDDCSIIQNITSSCSYKTSKK